MKQIAKYALGALALVMGACTADEPNNIGGNENNDGDFYATINLSLPTGTRSESSTKVGEEYGQDVENYVGKVLVILASKDEDGRYKMVTSAQSDARPGVSVDGTNQIKYVLNFDSKALKDDALAEGSTLPGTQNLYVFAYCNPTPEAINRYTKNDSFVFGSVFSEIEDKDNAKIWQDNNFLMTNCEISEAKNMPSREDLVNKHNTPQTAFDLGTVKVARVAARFDFQTTNDNQYVIKDIDGKTDIGTVELTEMAMFNIAKNFFDFPRTSDTWNWTTYSTSGKLNYNLCGDLEGFVMSYNPNNFKGKNTLSINEITTNYFSSLINNNLKDEGTAKSLTWTSIKPEVWNGKTDDNHNTWDGAKGTNYKIWRYTTENTIPGQTNEGTSNQKVGITTGVAFKGEFTPVDRTVWNGNVIYVYNNTVYGDYNALKEYVDKNPTSIVANAFNQVPTFKTKDEKDVTENLLNGLSEDEHHGFTAYEPQEKNMGENAKYVMYYFYYNRHNSNNNNNLMGINEFGVVRNNVYKLAVTKVGALGSPKSPEDPDTPDETENAYFTVSCIVMPWTVRINNIEF